MSNKIDMTGWYMPEHGVLDSLITVLEEDKEYCIIHNIKRKRAYWKCKCACGILFSACGSDIRSGAIKSCGCLHKKSFERIKKDILVDLTGYKFNNLFVLGYAYSKNGNRYWKCLCDCGNITYVSTSHLIKGDTKGCGCLIGKGNSGKYEKDFIGQRFGKLIVIKYLYTKNGNKYFLCQCDCGNTCEVRINDLVDGRTHSCGCIVSKGQELIRKILSENKIKFTTEKTYSDLKSPINQPLRFDFFINNEFLLEYDGEQHFRLTGGWGSKDFEKRQLYDQIKNNYAISHNIPLKRIPYWDFDKITLENIMSDKWLIN